MGEEETMGEEDGRDARDQYGCKRSDRWMTPPHILERLRCAHPGGARPIDIDPCAGEVAHLARHNVRPPGDGLELDWLQVTQGLAPALAFVNPPYSAQALAKWVTKCREQANDRLAVCALLPASTGSRWMFDHVYAAAQGLVWVKGRVSFLRPDTGRRGHTSPRGWSVLVWWGPGVDGFFDAMGPLGEMGRLVRWGSRRKWKD